MALAAAALLADCGSDEPPDDATPAQRTVFARQADGICAQWQERLRQAAEGFDQAQGAAQQAARARFAVETLSGRTDALEQLRFPPGDSDELAGWIVDLRGEQAALDELADAIEESDAASIDELSARLDARTAAVEAFARRYGMRTCASPD